MIPTPPKVITTKDLLYLKDQMSWLLLAIKKCNHFAQEAQDPQIKQALDKIVKMHQKHYQLILSHCQTKNQIGMAQVAGSLAQQQNIQQQQQHQGMTQS